jgi:D-alanine-D-alanine ligase
VHTCPARLDADVLERVQALAVRAHCALGCRDLSRVDFVVGEHELVVLEVNTLPGFTGTSLYPEAAGVDGIAFPALCDALARTAVLRGVSARNVPIPLPP